MIDTNTVALVLAAYGAGGVSSLTAYMLLREPRPQQKPVEGIDGLDDALSAGRDLPTAPLPGPHPGTVYASRHRRAGAGQWLARLGRAHPRRVRQ